MIIKTEKEFKENKIEDGIYFLYSNHCGTCKLAAYELKKFEIITKDWFMINCDKNTDYWISVLIDEMPLFRVYKNNKVTYQNFGVLYETQIKKIQNEWEKLK